MLGMSNTPSLRWKPTMLRAAALLVLCLAVTSCTVVDLGVGRGTCPPKWDFDGVGGYAAFGWTATDELLTADFLGGQNSGTLVSVDLWRLLHLELGLLGIGVGIGPIQFGGGVGFYTPEAPPMLADMNLFGDMEAAKH
jgi:hypothetical protein